MNCVCGKDAWEDLVQFAHLECICLTKSSGNFLCIFIVCIHYNRLGLFFFLQTLMFVCVVSD